MPPTYTVEELHAVVQLAAEAEDIGRTTASTLASARAEREAMMRCLNT